MIPTLKLADFLASVPQTDPFPNATAKNPPALLFSHTPIDTGEAAAWCFAQHTRRQGPAPVPGEGHNHWLAGVAAFCLESGADLSDVLALSLSTAPSGHDEAKIKATVTGIYQRRAADHGSKPYTAPYAQTAAAPPIPADLYDELPDYLRRCCQPFEGHERAVMLLSTLTVLSGCFPGIGGTYAQRDYGLNLFLFIIAQAASGKGSASWAQSLARPWHKRLTAESAAAQAEYEAEVANQKAAHKGKGPNPYTPPAAPRRRMLFIPGNTSAAAMLSQVAENEGRGIIFETEADTLSGAMGADFGNFSDVLRKGFQHEPVSVLRKTDRQHLDIERPAISIALTGTPGQLPRLMPTAEDGLVSRFLFYSFSLPPVWKDVSPRAGKPLSGYFNPLADELTRMIEAVSTPDESDPYPIQITLSSADWDKINEAGRAGLAEAVSEAGSAGGSTAFRLGLIAWRIAGILTVLRCFENGEAPSGELEADPRDVTTAIQIMDTARAHALQILSSLPTAPTAKVGPNQRSKDEQKAQARELHRQGLSYREIATKLIIGKSTISEWLKSEAA